MLIWNETLVAPFNECPVIREPPHFLEENFETNPEKVSDFYRRVKALGPKQRANEFITLALRGLSDSKIGLYSNMHDNAVFAFGCDHPKTIRLAYMSVLSFRIIIVLF